ncbi:MAG: hypothetical protein SO160_05300 [Lachnospiraceae bacterium]|uniref:hypothetical protein n=1 Tax=Roseburia hominis TaxID=301301 RepID=UPI001F318D77|nr:hypothetical protein [Roseburia hominis]MCI5712333.1 hypothetical protein [Lachnospiraceae bacterium]MDY4838946.1 hypothetical protein [Lachnospiraceae bacterium]
MEENVWKREIQEAIVAGQRALTALNDVEGSLKTAQGMGIWDILGGGFISGMLKHSNLDKANAKMEIAKRELENFSKEVRDVNLTYHCNVPITFDGFTKFFDYFCDGILVDALVQVRMSESAKEIRRIKTEVQNTLNYLYQI